MPFYEVDLNTTTRQIIYVEKMLQFKFASAEQYCVDETYGCGGLSTWWLRQLCVLHFR